MKQFVLPLVMLLSVHCQAQWNEPDQTFTLKTGAGYSVDFPGLTGVTGFAEASKRISRHIEVAAGFRLMRMKGFPRTSEVEEFTRATSVDFTLFGIPLSGEQHALKLGLGYSFAFYNKRNAYPKISTLPGHAGETEWVVQEDKGRNSNFNLIGEYEYRMPNSSLSLGLRAALYNAKDISYYVGPWVGIRL